MPCPHWVDTGKLFREHPEYHSMTLQYSKDELLAKCNEGNQMQQFIDVIIIDRSVKKLKINTKHW